MHFPEELSIKSFGSGYGGNALLGKKCHALRIASWQARTEGWLAEHMLIVGIENPQGEIHYLACAFPSACGKTNLAMLIPPASYRGWKVWTVGDDIAWLHPGKDGRLYAINPESGYFGVVPGTNAEDQPQRVRNDSPATRYSRMWRVTADNQPWWEGLSEGKPVTDWQGRPYDPANGPAAQPNSRFTVAAKLNPAYSKMADAPGGVPISAIVFGGRRRTLAPLVFQARNWLHGVLVGAGVASETTAAVTGKVGVLRRDPMAMKPFAGYNFGDYWSHWINVGAKLKSPPQIFHVNWFRQDARRQVFMAGLRRQPAGAAMDHRSLQGHRQRARHGHRATTACRKTWTRKDLDVAPGALEELLAVDPALWRERIRAGSPTISPNSATRVPPALATRARRFAHQRGVASSARSLLAGVANDLRGVAVRRLAEPDQSLAANLHGVAANEGFFAVFADDETCHSCSDRSA